MSRLRQYFQKSKDTLADVLKPVVNAMRGMNKNVMNRSMELNASLESEMVNPDSLLNDKGQDVRLYDKLMLDDTIKMAIGLKKTLTTYVQHKIIPASEEEKDKEIATFVDDNFKNLNNPSFDDIIDNLLDSMVYGYKIGEVLFKVEDSKIVWDKVKFQHPVLFDFTYDKKDNLDTVLYGYNFGGGTDNETTISAKDFDTHFLYMVNPYLKDGNWYGNSDLREVYFEWYSKYKIKRQRNIYIQKYATPFPDVAYVKKELKKGELDEMKNVLANWQDSVYLLNPSLRHPVDQTLLRKFDINWVTFESKNGAEVFSVTLKDINKGITRKLIIPDKIGFSDDSTGAYSQTKKVFEIMIMDIEGRQRRIENIINPKIKQLVDLNYAGVEEYPRFEYDEIDRGIERELLGLLLDKDVVDKRENWIRSYMNIPDLSEKEQAEIDSAKEEDVKKQQEAFEKSNPMNPQPNDKKPDEKQPFPPKDPKKQFKNSGNPVNFKQIENQLNTAEADFVMEYDKIHAEQSQRLVDIIQRKKIIENKDYKALNRLQIIKKDFKELFSVAYSKLYLLGKSDAIEEIEGRVKVKQKNYVQFQNELEWLDRKWVDNYLDKYGVLGTLTKDDKDYLTDLRQRSIAVTGDQQDRILKATYHTVDNGIRSGWTVTQTVAKLEGVLAKDRERYATTIARTIESDSYNSGRMNLFMSPDVEPFTEAFQYQAILDNDTTAFCEEHDGQIIKASDPAFATINPPNHFNCRSILTVIMVGENEIKGDFYYDYEERFDVWGTSVKVDNRLPAKGFGG